MSFWPDEKIANMFSWAAFCSIDFVGGVTLLCASGLLVFGIQQGGSGMTGWADPAVTAALVIAGVCWLMFISWEVILSYELLSAKIQPMFPIRLIGHRVYMGGLM